MPITTRFDLEASRTQTHFDQALDYFGIFDYENSLGHLASTCLRHLRYYPSWWQLHTGLLSVPLQVSLRIRDAAITS
jgi:hypothetical protein